MLQVVNIPHKTCSRCKTGLDLSCFGKAKHHKDGHKSQCKKCDAAWHANNYKKNDKIKDRNKAWVQANKAWKSNYQKEYFKKNPDKARDKQLKNYYGISLEKYNQMFAEQNGCCAICSRHQTEVRQTLCVDHNHSTGKIRKLLCAHCNHALGLLREDQNAVEAMVKYLQDDK